MVLTEGRPDAAVLKLPVLLGQGAGEAPVVSAAVAAGLRAQAILGSQPGPVPACVQEPASGATLEPVEQASCTQARCNPTQKKPHETPHL
jgi:hypothetical protein